MQHQIVTCQVKRQYRDVNDTVSGVTPFHISLLGCLAVAVQIEIESKT